MYRIKLTYFIKNLVNTEIFQCIIHSSSFFRILGSDSAPFGQTQDKISHRLTHAQYDNPRYNFESWGINIASGSWSSWLRVGGHVNNTNSIQFYVSGGEVRPRNYAVRIWKRTG